MNVQERDGYSQQALPQSYILAAQAKKDIILNGSTTVVCPKCRKKPKIKTTPTGERTYTVCECGYVYKEEINL